MYDFDSFVKHIPNTCRMYVRIADNVLEEEDWGIDRLIIVDDRVIDQTHNLTGAYRIPDMMGWTTDMLVEWSSYANTGTHPEEYHEISL